MTLQRRLDRVILDLEDIRDAAGYTNEVAALDNVIDALRSIRIYSDQMI